MTSPTEAAVIASRSALARNELQAGLVAPAKLRDAASALLLATAKRQAVISRLSVVASSVAMQQHRSIPSSSPTAKARLVTAASVGEVMS